MYVHIIETGHKFFCGLTRNEERAFVPVAMYREGIIQPVGLSAWCPICRVAADKEKK